LRDNQGRNLAPRSESEGQAPTTCPSCQSSSIVTTEKSPDASTYWRCENCGEVWNDSRLHAARSGSRRW
jgi:predicted Zn finger-like uncharacterized protein